MKPPRRTQRHPAAGLQSVAELMGDLSVSAEAEELLELIDLCRRSLRVRAWLFGRFAHDHSVRDAFRAFLVDSSQSVPDVRLWPREVMVALDRRSGVPASDEARHGGLSEVQVLALIKGHQAGFLDVTAFMVVRLWQRLLGENVAAIPLGLRRATERYWRRLAADETGRTVSQLVSVLRFFRERSGRKIGESDYGHPGSWRLHILVHLLDNPRPFYSVAELHGSLPPRYRGVDRREVRAFCVRYGIRRDQRPGRPRRSTHVEQR